MLIFFPFRYLIQSNEVMLDVIKKTQPNDVFLQMFCLYKAKSVILNALLLMFHKYPLDSGI